MVKMYSVFVYFLRADYMSMYSVFVYFLRADYMSMARRLMKLAPLSRFLAASLY